MEAREFLGQVRYLDLQVQSKLHQIEALKSLACRVTTVYSAEPVMHTRNVSGMEDVILRIMEAEDALNAKIDELVSAKLRIGIVINRVEDDVLRLILEKKYLEFETLDRIGGTLNFSSRYMRKLHGRALDEVQQILDEEENSDNCGFSH